MKSATGYVFYDEKRKRWIARLAPVDKDTGKQKEFKRYCLTKTDARKKLQELKNKYEKGGVKSINADKSNFSYLAEKFKKEKLVDAVYVGERKLAGRRELSAPDAWLKQLLFYFGSAKLNEMFTLEKSDIDFRSGVISVRAINAKTNRPRTIPMTRRVKEELALLNENGNGNLIFGGLKEVKRSFNTACRANKIANLRKHDFRHAFVSRSILAGIPPAVALKASGHASDEWKRYLNMTPDQLQKLFNPLEGQVVEDVKRYGLDVLQQLREALGYTDIANLIASLETRH